MENSSPLVSREAAAQKAYKAEQELRPSEPEMEDSVGIWGFLTVLSLLGAIGWVAYLVMYAHVELDPIVFIGVGNCFLACFTGSLIGMFAARKGRNAHLWALAFGLPAIVAGFFPLIIGAIVMAFMPPLTKV